ncbi:hypothetical protein Ancab_013935 [Ancistrocladus abbreviatus]
MNCYYKYGVFFPLSRRQGYPAMKNNFSSSEAMASSSRTGEKAPRTTAAEKGKAVAFFENEDDHILPLMKEMGNSVVPNFPCKFCGRIFPTQNGFAGHQNFHKNKEKIQRSIKVTKQVRHKSHLCSSAGPRASLTLGSSIVKPPAVSQTTSGRFQREAPSFNAAAASDLINCLQRGTERLGFGLNNNASGVGYRNQGIGPPNHHTDASWIDSGRIWNAVPGFNIGWRSNFSHSLQQAGNNLGHAMNKDAGGFHRMKNDTSNNQTAESEELDLSLSLRIW